MAPQGGATASMPITVAAGATHALGEQKMSRQQAIDILQSKVLSGVTNLSNCLILGSQQPIPAGVVISSEASGSSSQSIVLSNPSWLFFIDMYPTSGFAHPVKFALIDDSTGEVAVLDHNFWPRLNGVDIWFYIEERTGSDVIQFPATDAGVYTAIVAEGARMRGEGGITPSVESHASPCPTKKFFAIIVRGSDDGMKKNGTQSQDNPFLIADLAMTSALTSLSSYGGLRGVSPTFNSSFAAAFSSALAEVNPQMGPCDTLFIYIASHGGWSDESKRPDQTFMYKRTDKSLGKQQTQWVTAADLIMEVRKANINACHLVVLVDVCYSGSMIRGGAAKITTFENSFSLLQKRIEAVAISSTNATNSAMYESPSISARIFGRGLGSKFGNEFISSGLFGAEPAAINSGFGAYKNSGSAAQSQGADFVYRPATEPCAVTTGTPQIPGPTDPGTTPPPSTPNPPSVTGSCAGVTHYTGWSEISVGVQLANVAEGTTVTFSMGSQTTTGTTDASGRSYGTFTIYSYGSYSGTAGVTTDAGSAVANWDITVTSASQACSF